MRDLVARCVAGGQYSAGGAPRAGSGAPRLPGPRAHPRSRADAAETTLQELLEELRILRFLRAQVMRGAGGGRPGPRRRPRARSRSRPFGPSGHRGTRVQVQVGVGPLDGCTPQRLHALVESFATRLTVEVLRSPMSASVILALRHAAHEASTNRIDFFTPALVAVTSAGEPPSRLRGTDVDLTQARSRRLIRPVPVALPADPLESPLRPSPSTPPPTPSRR